MEAAAEEEEVAVEGTAKPMRLVVLIAAAAKMGVLPNTRATATRRRNARPMFAEVNLEDQSVTMLVE